MAWICKCSTNLEVPTPFSHFNSQISNLTFLVMESINCNSWYTSSTSSEENPEKDCGRDFKIDCKDGYLVKRGEIVKNWKKRWFVVQSDQMAYYVSKDSTKPQKIWDLKTLLKVEECSCENKKNSFCLMFVDRTMFCEAETPIQVEEWIAFFQEKVLNDLMKQKLVDMY